MRQATGGGLRRGDRSARRRAASRLRPLGRHAPQVRVPRVVVPRVVAGNGALVGLGVLVAVMSLASPVFATPANAFNVGEQAAVVAVMAIGLTFVVVAGGIDLSVGSVAALGGVAAALAWQRLDLPGPAAVAVGLAAGLVAGTVNGLLVAYAGFPPFVATLAMLSGVRGLTLVLSAGAAVPTPPAVDALGADVDIPGWAGGWVIPVPLLVPLVLGVVAALVLGRTRWGRWSYAIGGNPSAAARRGVPVRRVVLVAYAVSGLCAAVAGMIIAGRLSTAQPRAGVGDELDAISAVVIGGASLAGGYGSISGALTGALLLAVIRNSLNLLDVSSFWQDVAIGAVLVVAVGIDRLRQHLHAVHRPHRPPAGDVASDSPAVSRGGRPPEDLARPRRADRATRRRRDGPPTPDPDTGPVAPPDPALPSDRALPSDPALPPDSAPPTSVPTPPTRPPGRTS